MLANTLFAKSRLYFLKHHSENTKNATYAKELSTNKSVSVEQIQATEEDYK